MMASGMKWCAGALLALALVACSDKKAEKTASGLTGGDAKQGQQAIEKYGCGACHTVPGIPGAEAKVGPSLQGIAARAHLAGKLPNTPQNMMRWIQHPQEVNPGNVMPDLGLSDADTRDIAAYLYTLK